MGKLADHTGRHVQFGVHIGEVGQVVNDAGALRGGEHLGELITDLGCKQTEPDLVNLLAWCPKIEEFLQVTGTLHHLTSDGAVDDDLLTFNVFQDTVISGRSAADIVLGCETVDGDDNGQVCQIGPFGRQGTEGAGDDLDVDAAGEQLGHELLQFTVANQRVPADDGEMEGLEPVNDLKDPGDEFLAFVVSKGAQCDASAQVGLIVCIATRATEWAFAGNFNGERGLATLEDGAPGVEYVRYLHGETLLSPDGADAGELVT